ncbi:hypothetical protein AURDEDRAFT_165384 [Auricularia subglabra TFB-10046 SS5]|nr:hypothetical protein AURDEDRAFT_165384 [Auricularia subglabra TFB-10046 SS5]
MANYDEASLDRYNAILAQMAPGPSPFTSANAAAYLPSLQQPVNQVQLAIYNKFQTMQAQMNQQQAQLDVFQHKLNSMNVPSKNGPRRRRPSLGIAVLSSNSEGRRPKLTRYPNFAYNLVARIINEAIWLRVPSGDDDDDEVSPTASSPGSEQARLDQEAAVAWMNERAGWAKLPHPGEVRRHGESASWPCNFTIKSSAGCNLALRTHVTAGVRAALDNESINKTAISGCPDITVAAIEHVYKKRFDFLAAKYKAQTQAAAMIRLAEKQHKARVASSRTQKYNLRMKGISTFKRRHKGLDPTPYVHAEWMSGEESAGEDEGLKTLYFDCARIPEERRTALKAPKVLATQEVAWREEWHTQLLHRLDECTAACTTKSGPIHTRVTGGPTVDKLPKNRPPPCLVKTAWAESPSGRSQLPTTWDKDANPDDWQKLRDEVLSWAPEASTS